MRKLTVLLMTMAFLMLSLGQAYAVALVLPTDDPNTLYAEDSVSNLYKIDYGLGPTATATLVGPIKNGPNTVSNVSDISFANSGLWGVTVGNLLIQINPDTGAVISSVAVSGITGSGQLNALGTSLNGNTLYAAAYTTGQVGTLATNGTFSPFGAFGNSSITGNLLQSSGDLAFDPNDGTKLYAAVKDSVTSTNYLATVNLITGVATLIGPTGFAGTFGISFKDGAMYAITEGGQVFIIDTSNGTGSGAKSLGVSPIYGLTTSPIPLPPSVWLFGSGLLGLLGLRRKFFR